MKRKLLAALILFTGLSVYFTLSVSAYVDPATTSILIQSLAGVGAVLVTGVVVLWVTLKRRVKKALHIDDSTNTDGTAVTTGEKEAVTEKTEDTEEEIDFNTVDE